MQSSAGFNSCRHISNSCSYLSSDLLYSSSHSSGLLPPPNTNPSRSGLRGREGSPFTSISNFSPLVDISSNILEYCWAQCFREPPNHLPDLPFSIVPTNPLILATL